MEEPRQSWWIKYSPEFKQAAVDRLLSGESGTAIAKELGIRRKFLYAWRDRGFGTNGVRRDVIRAVSADQADGQQQQIARQQQKIAELERLTGQQAAELDFFAAALRAVTARGARGTDRTHPSVAVANTPGKKWATTHYGKSSTSRNAHLVEIETVFPATQRGSDAAKTQLADCDVSELVPPGGPPSYRELLEESPREQQIRLEKSLTNGLPCGHDAWIDGLEQPAHRRLRPAPVPSAPNHRLGCRFLHLGLLL